MDIQQTLQPGASVYGSDGEKIGKMISSNGSYIVVEKGFFLPKDYYIPVGVITDSSETGVYLSVSKDEVLDQEWDRQPTETGTTERDFTTRPAASTDQETVRVPVHEEHLQASKRLADAGEVTINKHVVTEQETIQVPVTEERVRVDWRAPSGEVTEDGPVFEEGTIEIPVSREVVDVSKRTVQTGELDVTKEREQRTQKVTDSVRREVVDIDDPSGELLDRDR